MIDTRTEGIFRASLAVSTLRMVRRLVPAAWRERIARLFPPAARSRLRQAMGSPAAAPRVGRIRFGDFRRLQPFCAHYGYSRGQPVDRYYIERFLQQQSRDVRGRVLEIGESTYTRRFGGDRVTRIDVLHVSRVNEEITIVGDLETGVNVPGETFDCFICTQTLNLIYDLQSAMQHAHRCLKPGGVLLLTVAAITPFARGEQEDWNAYWRLTSPVMRRLATQAFGANAAIEVTGFGNVLAATSFLFGLASAELTPAELDARDAGYELVVCVRAVKA